MRRERGREERDREERDSRKKSKVREKAKKKGAKHSIFHMFSGSGSLKSRLAKAAGASYLVIAQLSMSKR